MSREATVLEALGTVRDPELDEPVTELGFVSKVEVDGEAVRVSLRLPTYFCAPNFSWLMVADAQRALADAGFASAQVRLEDHFAAEQINSAVAEGRGFASAFPGQTDGADLEELRATFRRKAFLARQARLCRALLAAGHSAEGLAELRVRDLPDTPEVRSYLRRRADLGLDARPDAPLLMDLAGRPLAADRAADYLRLARTVAVSIDGNAALCRGLLATRYGCSPPR